MSIVISPPTQLQPGTSKSFFGLAGKIRNKIYDYALIGAPPRIAELTGKEECFGINSYAIRERRCSPPLPLRPSRNALAMTCRQAYYEGTRIFYESNRAVLHSGPVCNAYIASLPLVHLQTMTELTIRRLDVEHAKTDGFVCRRSEPEHEKKSKAAICRVEDHDFMSPKQIERLQAFSNLRSLTFEGRWHHTQPSEGSPGASINLLKRVMALGNSLEHLETIAIVSYLSRWHKKHHPRQYVWRMPYEQLLIDAKWKYKMTYVGKPVSPGGGEKIPDQSLVLPNKLTGEKDVVCSMEILTRRTGFSRSKFDTRES